VSEPRKIVVSASIPVSTFISRVKDIIKEHDMRNCSHSITSTYIIIDMEHPQCLLTFIKELDCLPDGLMHGKYFSLQAFYKIS